MKNIHLVRISKQTLVDRYEFFDTFEELEKRLSKISSSHYGLNEFYVGADNINALYDFFRTNYNENYYEFQPENYSRVRINKLKVGEKRKKFYVSKEVSPKSKVDKAIGRLQKKYGLSYDKDLGVIEIPFEENTITLSFNEEKIEIENISINNVKTETIKEMNKIAKELVRYFKKLKKRLEE